MEAKPAKGLAKKLWNIVRIMFFMIRKGISKSKLMAHLHTLMNKRGKISAKSIGKLMFHDSHHLSFVVPRDYEFSCSNSPAPATNYKRKAHHHRSKPSLTLSYDLENDDHLSAANAVQQILMEMLHSEAATAQSSPALPGFGRSPLVVRQLRVTDSPFPLRNAEEDHSQVDKAAEEFIQRFYAQLRLQI